MTTVGTPAVVAEQTRVAEQTLQEVEDLLRSIDEADLHRAHPDGGWTGAHLVSHMTLAGLLWVGDVQRLVPTPTSTSSTARRSATTSPVPCRRVPPTRSPRSGGRSWGSCRRTEEVLRREVEIATPGRRTVADWLPVIVGHLAHHRDQLHDVLRSRGRLPERFDRPDGAEG